LRVGKSTTSEGKKVDDKARVGNEVGLILPRPMKRCSVVVLAA
jgi:hypothetical protein